MKILRVFPRRTSCTPNDNMVAIGYPGLFRVKAKSFKWACEKLKKAGFTRNHLHCYVLAGFGEPIQASEDRLRLAYECGTMPFIQPYRKEGKKTELSKSDRQFIHRWSRPAIIRSIISNMGRG